MSDYVSPELSALAPAYALGALDRAEAERFEAALAGSSELRSLMAEYSSVASLLAFATPAVDPPGNLKAQLFERIRASGRTVDYDAIEWEPQQQGTGFQIHWLRNNDVTGELTVLLKGEPGASYPDHRHPGGEQFFVLNGSFADQRAEYHAGDFYRFPAGSEHRNLRVTGKDPCILLVITGPGGIDWIEESLSAR